MGAETSFVAETAALARAGPATRYGLVLHNGNASDTITPFLCIWRYQWKRVRHKSAHYCVSGVSDMNKGQWG